jgi:hypothetical protein
MTCPLELSRPLSANLTTHAHGPVTTQSITGTHIFVDISVREVLKLASST